MAGIYQYPHGAQYKIIGGMASRGDDARLREIARVIGERLAAPISEIVDGYIKETAARRPELLSASLTQPQSISKPSKLPQFEQEDETLLSKRVYHEPLLTKQRSTDLYIDPSPPCRR